MTGERRVRVVLVDDHPVVRDGLRGMFEAEPGVEVVGEAASGPEALALCRRLREGIDVVLMDLRMPGGGGVEAIRRLRAGGPEPRVLVLTTYDTDDDIRTALEAGADGYLLKDARGAELVRAVRDLASGVAVFSPDVVRSLARRPTAEEPLVSPRELEVLRVIAGGGTNKAAADRLFVSEATVKTHLRRAYAKLGVSDRAAAVRVAFERGLLPGR
ncbi:response regulator [Mobilicoccus massiliensis]|uniref:response regulator n=1 Tax=Mobilicoccus massiliensis TaxID=1522310 RepID=UPI00058B2DC5|nr:response regulator transcription factor [Mobilicoccus massiliensis]